MNRSKNHRVIVSRHGRPDVLLVVVEDIPEPRAGEVCVKVQAAGVSAFDLIYRRWGRLPGSPRIPFTLGEDVVGTVDAIGEGVSSLSPGEMVAGGTWARGVGGGYSEHVCLPASDLVPVPSGVDPAEAVCLVVNYLTAHQHLHAIGGARCGERVLVHGAAGGVGTALLELSRIAGLEVYGTASPRNADLVESLGATPIDYKAEDFVARIAALTGDGVDLVIDPVGGASQLWRSYRSLRKGGRLVWLGSAAIDKQGLRVGPLSLLTVSALRLLPDGKHVPPCPVMAKYAQRQLAWYRATLSELLDLLAVGKVAPVVAERVPLERAARGHELLERGGHRGKVVLVTRVYEEQ